MSQKQKEDICGERTHRGKICENDKANCPHHGVATDYRKEKKHFNKLQHEKDVSETTKKKTAQQVKQEILETVEEQLNRKIEAAGSKDELFVKFDARLYNGETGLFKGELERSSAEVQGWRKQVLERDNHECQKCGNNDKLEVHHIKPWSKYPELRTKVSNGITLCGKCHDEKHTD